MIALADKITKSFGGRVLYTAATLQLNAGERWGLVGPNGAGKTTLLKIMMGLEEPDEGTVSFARDASIGYLEQETHLAGEKSALGEVVDSAVEVKRLEARIKEMERQISEMPEGDEQYALLERYGAAQDRYERLGGYELEARAKQILGGLGFPVEDFDKPAKEFSGGWQMRIALSKLLLRHPDLLLLDEPTNHLDAESVLWLEQFLKNYQGAVLAVTHDRYFLDNVAEWICEVDRGTLYPYKGNYSTYLETKSARLEMESKQNAKRAKKMRDELAWVRSSQKARQAKSKARLAAYEEMEAAAARAEKVDYTDIHLPVGPRLGNKVLEANHLHKAFGDRVLIDDLSFSLPRNGIVGVIGPNGVGKSTLFKMIVGQEPVSSGSLELGETVKLSYVDQNREGLDPQKTVWEVVSGGNDYITVGKQEIPSRAYVSAFGFKGTDQQKRAGVLSGGERNRLNLALTLRQGGNLVLLDEPTNDLDTETLESLEEALLEFPGCCVITSHDRWFMDRICTHILAWEGTDENPGAWHWFEGNFEGYQKDRVKRLGPDLSKPHRLHRKLTRD